MIRAARFEDEESILALGEAMHAEAPAHIGSGFSRERASATFRGLLTNSQTSLILVAEVAGQVVGLFVGACHPHWSLDETVAADMILYVHPAHRGGTLGLRLVKAYEAWARERGAARIFLSTSTLIDSERFAQLFERIGFKRVGIALQKRLEG